MTHARRNDTHTFLDPPGGPSCAGVEPAERVADASCLLAHLTSGDWERMKIVVSAICGAPQAAVILFDNEGRVFPLPRGSDAAVAVERTSAVVSLLQQTKTIVVPDTQNDERFRHGGVETAAPSSRFLAAVPLQMPGNGRIGTLCVLDSEPRVLRDEQITALEAVVSQLAADLTLRKKVATLEQAHSGTREDVQALRAGQQQLQHVIEGSRDGFWDWDMITGRIEISRRLAEMLGYELDDIEPTSTAWRALVHPDDEAGRARLLEEYLDGSVSHYEGEHRKRTKSGGWKWILTRGKITERAPDGTPLRMTGTQTDIDERKRAEEALDRFFSLSLDLLCIAGLDGVLKRVNPAFSETFGYTSEELLTTSFLDFVHPEDRKRAERELEGLRSGSVTTRFDVRCICRDGSVKWATFTAAPHMAEQLIYAVGRDVTEERLAAQAIAESEEKYRDLFENATDMIQSVDEKGAFLYVNRAWMETLGYDHDDVGSLTIEDVIDPDQLEHCREILARVMSGERVPKMVVDFRTKNGEKRTVEGTVNCRFLDGRALSTRGIFRDVTEQRKAEEEVRASESAMRSIIGSSLSGIATFDHIGLIESLNPAAEKILGYSSAELVGKCASVILADPPPDLGVFRQEILHHSVGHVTEWEVIRGDGRPIQIELALFEFQTKQGKQLAGNIQDISQRREVERMKREFVSTVSHELRTPLTSIRGALDLLGGSVFGELTADAAEVVSIAHRNTTRLIALTNDILDLDRQDSGRFAITLEPVAITTLFSSAVDAVSMFAAESGLTIVSAAPEIVVEADSRRIVQVLVNLLSNAIKFSPAGTTIHLTAAEEDDEIVLRVEDQGRGIPQAYLQKIFDRFQQVEASDARSRFGSGLGLTISRAIVQQHRGSIGVTSNEGEGSTFWVRLPRGKHRWMLSPEDAAGTSVVSSADTGDVHLRARGSTRSYALHAAGERALASMCPMEGGGDAPVLSPERRNPSDASGGMVAAAVRSPKGLS